MTFISNNKGNKGDRGQKGEKGDKGENGIVKWSEYNLNPLYENHVISYSDNNEQITQKVINTIGELSNISPSATNDYISINKNTTVYLQPINNDVYKGNVVLSIVTTPSNGIATIEPDGKTIKYIPSNNFTGGDTIVYKITHSLSSDESTASIFITVNEIMSNQSIQSVVLSQLQTLLESNEYWDIGIPVGSKMIISNLNLDDFSFTNVITAGKGKSNTKWTKWAVCNGNNGTENLTNDTFRGFNHTNNDYDESGKSGGSDNLSLEIILEKDNIPLPDHSHTGITSVVENITNEDAVSIFDEAVSESEVTELTKVENAGDDFDIDDTTPSHKVATLTYKTSESSDETEVTPISKELDIRNKYKTLIIVQKIL